MSLADDLIDAATPPPPKDLRPYVTYSGGQPAEIVTDPLPELEDGEYEEAVRHLLPEPLPDGTRLQLVSAEMIVSHNPAAWKRDPEDRRENHTAYTGPNTIRRWRYKFKVVAGSAFRAKDLEKAMKEARKATRGRPVKPKSDKETTVVNMADFQVSKKDILGGTPELLERSEVALAQVLDQIRKTKPAEIILIDNGDSTEGFNSAPNAARVNDLQETEALYVWGEIFWRWITQIGRLAPTMRVLSVPSNHCRNRKGKDAVGPISDDWGLLTLRQLAKRAQENETAYGHIDFIVPRPHEEHITITLAGGKILTAAHGHQVNQPDQVAVWAKGKSPREVILSDIVVVGHFHHLRVQTYGEHQFLFICPTMDNGSSHYTPKSGEDSRPGLLTFMVDEEGWHDVFVAWA